MVYPERETQADDRMKPYARHYIRLQFNGKAAAIAAGYSSKTAEAAASTIVNKQQGKGLLCEVFGADE